MRQYNGFFLQHINLPICHFKSRHYLMIQYWEAVQSYTCWWKNKIIQSIWSRIWPPPTKSLINSLFGLTIPLLGIYLGVGKVTLPQIHKNMWTSLFTLALFLIAKYYKQSQINNETSWINYGTSILRIL